jgi:uncharacterized membrane protein
MLKFTCSVTIDVPRDIVTGYFRDPAHLPAWQEGFVSLTPAGGEPGQPGARAIFRYQRGRRPFQLEETILENELPKRFVASYQHTHMINTMTSQFHAPDAQSTRWEVTVEYDRFRGLLPRLMALLAPGQFRRQTQAWLDRFKRFAERRYHDGRQPDPT